MAVSLALGACGGGGSGGGTSLPQFCKDALAASAAITSRTSNNIAPLGKAELTSLAAQLRTLAGEAPSQIKADVTTDADFFDKASINGIDAVDANTTSATSAADDRIAAFEDSNCGSTGS